MARPNTADSNRYLDSNNRLSSAGAAQSLKYARPQDLPSYPTSGLPPNSQRKQDATTAATLGWQNQKSVQPWKPEQSGAAATAATRGWSTTAPKQWQPEQSMNGARAAVLAASRNKNLPPQGVSAPPTPAPRPAPSSWGNTAANLAVSNSKAKRPGTATPPNTTYRPTDIDRHGSLMAATGAMAPRRRADSSPAVRPSYPDQANAKANALRAATRADSNARTPQPKPVGGANPAVQMPRSKFGYNPGSQPQVDEKAHQEAMQSSAIAMAQQMYKIMEKNKIDKEATAGASSALGRNRSLSLSSGSDAPPPMRFTHLHDTAQRLAAQRMAEMHDEEAQSREYREYYAGHLNPPPQESGGSKRLSLGNLFRRNRRNSDDSMDDDNAESRKIRAQMAVFSSSLSKVDVGKRQSDRDHLLAIAQRNVQRDLRDIDQKVYDKTGKVTPQMAHTWEQQAHAQKQAEFYAQQQHEERMQNYGRIDIGGGTYMDQEQIDDLARRNVQPVLNDIEVHNKERIESEETKRLDEEERKRLALVEKQREKESKELEKHVKQQIKEDAKARKEEEKLSRKQSKSKRLSRFGSLSRSHDGKSPESGGHVADAPPVLAPVAPQEPISLTNQARDTDDIHHMSGAVRTSTSDTQRATRDSLRENEDVTVAPPIAVGNASDNPELAREINDDIRQEVPIAQMQHQAERAEPGPVVQAPASFDPENVQKPITIDATPGHATAPVTVAATGPAPNTTAYSSLPPATPPAQVLTKKNAGSPETGTGGSSPKEKGVKSWFKKAFRRGSSGDDGNQSSKRNSKIMKGDPKGKRPVIGEPVNQNPNQKAGPSTPTESTAIGLGGRGASAGRGATSGPLDSHPDVHAVDRTIYDASPPRDQREAAIAYERDQERANDELAISDIDSELDARTRGARGGLGGAEQDASTVSMLSQSSMERKRAQELEAEKAGGSGGLEKVKSDAAAERAAEKEEERDGLGDVQAPKFPVERAQSPARETRFREDV